MTTSAATPAPAKRVLLLIYDSFAEFEVAVLLTALSGTPHALTTCALSAGPVTSTGGLQVLPDITVADVDPDDFDALVVPGGEASGILGHAELRRIVTALDARGNLLAAICGGPALLGDAGVLDTRSYTAALTPQDPAWRGIDGRGVLVERPVVTDGHVVTAIGSHYIAFAEEVLRRLDERPSLERLTYFREPSAG